MSPSTSWQMSCIFSCARCGGPVVKRLHWNVILHVQHNVLWRLGGCRASSLYQRPREERPAVCVRARARHARVCVRDVCVRARACVHECARARVRNVITLRLHVCVAAGDRGAKGGAIVLTY